MTSQDWKEKIQSLPPGLTLKQVAKRLNKPYERASFWCNRVGYIPKPDLAWSAQRLREFRKVTWERVNWEMPNVYIAKVYGVSREIVRRRRKEYGPRIR